MRKISGTLNNKGLKQQYLIRMILKDVRSLHTRILPQTSQSIRIILKDDEIYINCLPRRGGNYFVRKWNPEKLFNN